MRRASSFLALTFIAFASVLQAQGTPSVQVGSRVRIESPVARGIFSVVRVTDDTVTVRTDALSAPVAVPRADMTRLALSMGRRSAGSGAWRGALTGAALGAVVGAATGLASGDDDESAWFAMSAGEKAVGGGVALGLGGAILGGVVGAIYRGERWERTPLLPRVGMMPAAGERMAVATAWTLTF
jgi:hypothetical protein